MPKINLKRGFLNIIEAVTSASFPTTGKDGSTFYGMRFLKGAEKERIKLLKSCFKRKNVIDKGRCWVDEGVGPEYVMNKKSSFNYGKNPKCDVLRPPDIDCTRANLNLKKYKKKK